MEVRFNCEEKGIMLYCPNCGKEVTSKAYSINAEFMSKPKVSARYCCKCGAWGDVNLTVETLMYV